MENILTVELIFESDNPLVKKALEVCKKVHEEHFDKVGRLYYDHSIRIARRMKSDDEIIVALLHDVINKSSYNLFDLENEGIPQNCIEALKVLTENPDINYGEYIINIKNSLNNIAISVKKYDLMDDINLTRFNIDNLTLDDLERTERYIRALKLFYE